MNEKPMLLRRYNQILALLRAEGVDPSDHVAVKRCLSETVAPTQNYVCYMYFHNKGVK